jgi:hypothetical protein
MNVLMCFSSPVNKLLSVPCVHPHELPYYVLLCLLSILVYYRRSWRRPTISILLLSMQARAKYLVRFSVRKSAISCLCICYTMAARCLLVVHELPVLMGHEGEWSITTEVKSVQRNRPQAKPLYNVLL